MSDFDRLLEALAQVEEIAAGPPERYHRRIDALSGWSVSQHLHHALVVDARIRFALGRIEQGEADPPRRGTVKARLVMMTRRLARGATRPDWAKPADGPPAGEILSLARDARAAWVAMREREEDFVVLEGTLPHHLLGPLTAARWIRFADIHLRHHLKLARELLAAPLAS